jgi:hypothetical protein
MFEFIFSAEFITAAIVFSAAGAFLGVGLARRSQTANAYYDRIRAKWDEEREELRRRIRELEARSN